jgi:hypothetical protein
MKTEMEKDGNKKDTENVSLAFRVKAHGDNLFSAEILMLMGDVVIESRHGIATTLGHAIGAADDLMDGWAFSEIEQKAEEYFRQVYL